VRDGQPAVSFDHTADRSAKATVSA
jgi:hypothetical protein